VNINTTKSSATTRIKRTAYWRRTRQLTVKLLFVWFAVTLITIFFARELSGISLFGWPLSFYMAAQGATLIYLLIVGIYAWRMRQLEKNVKSEVDDGK
jgi:putative solute:sodium symporter small subunit